MKQVLIIAYYFPPVAASGAMRPLAFCKYLGGYGWASRVLTTDPKSVYPAHPVDEKLSQKVPSSVRVDRVPHENPMQHLIAWRDRLRARFGSSATEATPRESQSNRGIGQQSAPSRGGSLSALKHLVLDWAFAFPDPQCAWHKPAVAYAKQWPKCDIPDVIYATGGPWTSFLVAATLSEYWQVPFVMDYRDPWTSNPYVSFASPALNRMAKRRERGICLAASQLIANTEELKQQLQCDYPDMATKMLALTNGYDPESFGGEGTERLRSETVRPRLKRSKIELCHFGTVYGKRTPVVLLQVLADLYREKRLREEQLCLRFVGAWDVDDAHCEELALQLEKCGLLKRESPVSYEACLQQMALADALLIIQPDSPLQIPGKIYEYIATGRPLVLVGGEGATANLVRGNQFGITCPNKAASIEHLLLSIAEGREALRAPDRSRVARFSYRSLTAEVAKVLDVARVSGPAFQREAR